MEKKYTLNQNLIVRCLVWGLPAAVIFSISLLIAMNIGDDFSGNFFVVSVIFVVSCIILGAIYLTVFQFLPQDILTTILRKRHQAEPALIVEDSELEQEAITPSSATEVAEVVTTEKPETKAIAESTPALSEDVIQSIYEQRNQQHQSAMQQKREQVMASIMSYILDTMSPYADMETIRIIQGEVTMWLNDLNHEPTAVHVKNGFTTLDCRHFTWNITSRMRMLGDNIPTSAQGLFIKKLFKDVCNSAEADYLGKNLTIKSEEGHILLDKPTKDDWRFRFEKGEAEEE